MSEAIKINIEKPVSKPEETDTVLLFDSTSNPQLITVGNLLALVRSNLQIGGRNLVPDSGNFSGWTPKTQGHISDGFDGNFAVRKSSGAFRGGYRNMSFSAGAIYTFSIFTDSLSKINLFIGYVNDLLVKQTATFSNKTSVKYRPVKDGWYQAWVTATCTSSGTALLEYETNNISDSETVRFCAPKLEIGNMPTDWSPAPEDLGWGG